MRSRKYIPMLMLLALLSCAGKAGAQTVAVKSDLLTGGMLASPNLGVELKLSERFTLEAGVYYNPFRQEETNAGNTGSCSRSCATGCASPTEDISSGQA